MHEQRIREVYWAAGFLEGEGSFCAADGYVQINAGQKEREPLDRLQGILGGRIYNPGVQPIHRWVLAPQAEVEAVVELLRPLLSSRRQQQIDDAFAKRAAYKVGPERLRANAKRAKAARDKYHSDPEWRERRLAQQRAWASRNPDYKRQWVKRKALGA